LLIDALHNDLDYVQEHARLLTRVLEWIPTSD